MRHLSLLYVRPSDIVLGREVVRPDWSSAAVRIELGRNLLGLDLMQDLCMVV